MPGQQVNAIILGAVIFFELIGSYLLKRALENAGEAGKDTMVDHMQLGSLVERESSKALVLIGNKLLAPKNAEIIGQIVRRINGKVIALHVMTTRSPQALKVSRDICKDVMKQFEKLMQEEEIDFKVRVEKSDKVAEMICRVAREEDVGLVMMRASGRSRFLGRFFVGETGKVTGLLGCPVVVLPGRQNAEWNR